MHTAYLILGSNVNPLDNTRRALELLRERLDVRAVSTCWETPPVGTGGPLFINAGVCVQTDKDAGDLKFGVLRGIEAEMGRVRTADKYAPRPIDLDIVIFDGQVLDEGLWEHAYLALPFAELLPDLTHPQTGRRLADLAGELNRDGAARPAPGISSTRA